MRYRQVNTLPVVPQLTRGRANSAKVRKQGYCRQAGEGAQNRVSVSDTLGSQRCGAAGPKRLWKRDNTFHRT